MIANISKVMSGEVEADALYLGTTLIWKKYTPTSFDVDFSNFNNNIDPEGSESRLNYAGDYDWSWLKGPVLNTDTFAGTCYYTRDCWDVENVSETEGGTAVPSLRIYFKKEDYTLNGKTWPVKVGTVFSKPIFGKGRIDVRAKMMAYDKMKNTIWGTTSTMEREFTSIIVDPVTHEVSAGPKRTLKYQFEFDIVEYTPGNPAEGVYGTNRAMWCWQENKQSLFYDWENNTEVNNKWCRVEVEPNNPDNPDPNYIKHGWVGSQMLSNQGPSSDVDMLPWLYLDEDGEPHSLSNGIWYPRGATGDWYLLYHYNICKDGNRLKGKDNGCYYFIKNYVIEKNGEPRVIRKNNNGDAYYINSDDLHWIKYDPVHNTLTEGVGLETGENATGYFMSHAEMSAAERGYAIGTGDNVNGNLNGENVVIGDWHTWSLEVTEDRVRYLCDDYAYLDIDHSTIAPLYPTDDYAFGFILATLYLKEYYDAGVFPDVNDSMIISSIHFTPEASIETGDNSTIQN